MKKVLLSLCLLVLVAAAHSGWAADASKTIIFGHDHQHTQDSGLLDALLPVFEKQTGYFVKTIAVGSGQAMMMGRKGEADVLLAHSPTAEKQCVDEGYGINRRLVMHNDFVIVGPKDDPDRIHGASSTVEALKHLSGVKALFISRGDNSGTHAQEKALWKSSGLNPEGQGWYQQTGLGMGQTLNVAAEKKGYTFTDRGTWLAVKKTLILRYSRKATPSCSTSTTSSRSIRPSGARSTGPAPRPLPTSCLGPRPRK